MSAPFASFVISFYTDHFGLIERPFSLVPDPAFLFWGPAHRAAFSMLEYGLMTRAPITLLTGEVGAGKTTLLHHLLGSLKDDLVVGMVANAQGDRGDILRWVMLALDQPSEPSESYVDLFSRFQAFLIDRYGKGLRVILIFDEAQNLTREALEELRMFTNINSGKDELVQLILVGQPELRDTILAPGLTQFAQRVSASFHLRAMDRDGVAEYVRYRLEIAGTTDVIFSDDAIRLVHAATGGVPRQVNKLCDMAMVYAFSADTTQVGIDTIQQILKDGVLIGAPTCAEASERLLLEEHHRV